MRCAIDWEKRLLIGSIVKMFWRTWLQHISAPLLLNKSSRAPIVHAGNAVESFLSQLAAHHGVNVQNAHGINAKVDVLAKANHLLSKHKFMVKYLGHVRNAADHGVDAEIGTQWRRFVKDRD